MNFEEKSFVSAEASAKSVLLVDGKETSIVRDGNRSELGGEQDDRESQMVPKNDQLGMESHSTVVGNERSTQTELDRAPTNKPKINADDDGRTPENKCSVKEDAVGTTVTNEPNQQKPSVGTNLWSDNRFYKLLQLTERLFRIPEKWPMRTWTLLSQLRRRKLRIDQSRLVGEFFNLEDNGEWRVFGLRATRNDIAAIEYDVLRIATANIGINCTAFREVNTTAMNDHILKVCNSDSSSQHQLFMSQYKLLKNLSQTYRNFRMRKHFPKVFGCGAFEELCYKEKITNANMVPKLLIYFPGPNPRPYFIQEKIEPTLEEIQRMPRSDLLSTKTSCDCVMGCVMALRLLHRMGYVHRCIAPYNFAIRLDAFRSHCRVFEQICLIDFTLCKRFKGPSQQVKFNRVTPFVGTYKYCAIAAHQRREQQPRDDILSCLFMLYEFIYGDLPWRHLKHSASILKKKEKLIRNPMNAIMKAPKQSPVDPFQFQDLFQIIDDVTPYVGEFPYRKLYRKLHSMTAANVDDSRIENLGLRSQTINELITCAVPCE